MTAPIVSLIAAVARNGAIGAGNAMPWRIPSDLKHFRALTMGKPLIMGRKTFDSLGKPLQGRECIVVTRNRNWSAPGVATARDLDEALRLALSGGAGEITVGGGGEIYAGAIGIADRLYITEVDLAPAAEAWFPRIDPDAWREVSRRVGVRGEKDEAGFTFVEYARRKESRQSAERF